MKTKIINNFVLKIMNNHSLYSIDDFHNFIKINGSIKEDIGLYRYLITNHIRSLITVFRVINKKTEKTVIDYIIVDYDKNDIDNLIRMNKLSDILNKNK